MIELTPLHPGTIKDLFSPKRTAPATVRQKPFDPLGLPQDRLQCVHVGIEELSEGYDYVRCVKSAVTNRHGWLCSEHGADYYTPRQRVYRDKDLEIVSGILAYEYRALRDNERVTVQIGARTKIE